MPESQSKLARVTISDDILIEILLFLPTKSLLRMKSVCKQWHTLICSHRFCLLHTLRHPTATTISTALLLRRWGLHYYHLSLKPDRSCIKTPLTLPGYVLQSCHGLLLCRFHENAPADYFIYNLATGLYRTLDLNHNDIEGLTLAFDPSKSAYYKLVCVKAADPSVEGFMRFSKQIDVFDSETSSWTVVMRNYNAPVPVISFWGLYWNNAVHWIGFYGGSLYFDIDKGTIGQATKIPPIHRAGYHGFTHLFVESSGHLHYIMSDGSKLSVFEMENDYSNWSIKYRVAYGGLSSDFTEYTYVRGIVRAQNEQQSFLLFYAAGKFMAYNCFDGSFQELTGLEREEFNGEDLLLNQHYNVQQFVETLAPV